MVSKKLLALLGICLALAAFTLTRSEDTFVEDIDFDDPIAFSETDDGVGSPLGSVDPTASAGDDEELPLDVVVFTPPAQPRDPFTQLSGGVSSSLTIDDADPLLDEDLLVDDPLD